MTKSWHFGGSGGALNHGWARFCALATMIVAGVCGSAHAAFVNVATWTQNENTAGGSLTLNGVLAGNAVTLQTAALPPNAGLAGFEDWSSSAGTSGFVTSQSPTSGNTWIAIDEGTSTTEVVTFASPVVNPVVLINFDDPTVTYNWGNLSVSLLSENNALLAGDVLTFPGASNTDSDGTAVQIRGTFATFSFVASDTNGSDSQRFTVAAVPEPASCGLAAIAAAALLGRRHRVHESKL